VAVGYYFPAPPGNQPPEIETTRRKVDAPQLKPLLTAPNIQEITVACLESGGRRALDEIQDGSSILTSLKLLATNVPAATLRKLFNIPTRLRYFHWQRLSFVCAMDLTNPPNRCVAARPHELQEAFQLVSQSLERLSLEMVEQHRCQKHEYETLDLNKFENLTSLPICLDFLMPGSEYACRLGLAKPQSDEPVYLVDCLPYSLLELHLFDSPRRSRKIIFWSRLIRHLVEHRA
jgi:hypothetical protein